MREARGGSHVVEIGAKCGGEARSGIFLMVFYLTDGRCPRSDAPLESPLGSIRHACGLGEAIVGGEMKICKNEKYKNIEIF